MICMRGVSTLAEHRQHSTYASFSFFFASDHFQLLTEAGVSIKRTFEAGPDIKQSTGTCCLW